MNMYKAKKFHYCVRREYFLKFCTCTRRKQFQKTLRTCIRRKQFQKTLWTYDPGRSEFLYRQRRKITVQNKYKDEAMCRSGTSGSLQTTRRHNPTSPHSSQLPPWQLEIPIQFYCVQNFTTTSRGARPTIWEPLAYVITQANFRSLLLLHNPFQFNSSCWG
jgi:hypothetical protein